MTKALLFALFSCAGLPAFAQEQKNTTAVGTATATSSPSAATAVTPLDHKRLAPESAYSRVYCVVPLVGTGTPSDPIRPMFVQLPTAATPLDRTGIIAYQYQLSDDGTLALAEFVSVGRAGILPVLSSTVSGIVSFERGQHTRQEVEAAFQKYKKNFSFSNFMPVRVQ